MALYIKKFLRCAGCIGAVFFLAGCATVHGPEGSSTGVSIPTGAVAEKGVQHKVRKGETLWRIARTYKVSVEDITHANGIPNAASIEENQLLFIPGADSVQEILVPSPSEKDADYAWPVKGKVVAFFQDHKGAAVNAGIDIRAVEGEAVRAARSGRVVMADRLSGHGHAVILDHGDGFFTVYAHNARILAALGDEVLKGAKIAEVARDGDLAYLHFEVRKGSRATNPLYYLP